MRIYNEKENSKFPGEFTELTNEFGTSNEVEETSEFNIPCDDVTSHDTEVINNQSNDNWQKETKNVILSGRQFTVNSLVPILTAEENEKRRQDAEQSLYNVITKYRDKRIVDNCDE